MKNFVQQGNNVSVPTPYAVNSGDGVLVGSLFGVASGTAAGGADVVLATVGVFDLKKASAEAWAVGAAIYWDDGAKECTSDATDNTKIGVALMAAANPSTTGRVRLAGFF